MCVGGGEGGRGGRDFVVGSLKEEEEILCTWSVNYLAISEECRLLHTRER